MKLRTWTFGRIIAFLLLGPTTLGMVIGLVSGLYSWIFGESDIGLSDYFVILLLTVFTITLFLYLTMPRYYGCMQAVKGYMSYRDLKKHIRKESFIRPVKFWNEKYKKESSHLYVSENWICADNASSAYSNPVCIPRKLLYTGFIRLGNISNKRGMAEFPYISTFVLTIKTLNGFKMNIGYIKPEQVEEVKSILKNEFPEFSDIEGDDEYISPKELKKNFESKVKSKKEFLEFIS